MRFSDASSGIFLADPIARASEVMADLFRRAKAQVALVSEMGEMRAEGCPSVLALASCEAGSGFSKAHMAMRKNAGSIRHLSGRLGLAAILCGGVIGCSPDVSEVEPQAGFTKTATYRASQLEKQEVTATTGPLSVKVAVFAKADLAELEAEFFSKDEAVIVALNNKGGFAVRAVLPAYGVDELACSAGELFAAFGASDLILFNSFVVKFTQDRAAHELLIFAYRQKIDTEINGRRVQSLSMAEWREKYCA